jgi:hypothetical protein
LSTVSKAELKPSFKFRTLNTLEVPQQASIASATLMTDQLLTLDISAPQIIIVAAGDTPSNQANARGHLFEKFVARLLEAYGCNTPTKAMVNVRQHGYEVDISTSFTLTREPAIAECKAYTSVLPLSALSTFYGKLGAERLDHELMHGWFVAIPGMTADGHEMARKLESKDKRFRLVTAIDIYQLVQQKSWAKPIHAQEGDVLSDHALLLTENGVAALAKQLNPLTRLPVRVLVLRAGGNLTPPELTLLSATDYANGLPVVDCAAPNAVDQSAQATEAPTVVAVVGSGTDFEYQFPASPAFFVGRKDLLARVEKLAEDAGGNGRVIVLNAQSGWGKSSLALRLAHQVDAAGGSAAVFDTRTATAPAYVAAALRKAMTDAEQKGKLSLPSDASFASLQSALKTLQTSAWHTSAPLLIIFDQFENVFRNYRLTQEFRNLALSVRELSVPILIGFCWKTDLVGLTENYPYRLRDEIRGASLVINVEPFGPREVGTLLARLAKAAGTSLSADLKQRLREYSQGLPWLLKKLASHILIQLQAGTTEETLLAESLNIEGLFEQDLALLEATEVEALKGIARVAPVLVTEIVERVNPSVIQSLVDQRLVVRVGERIDVYWDTFRDFLISGKLSVEDTYILRQRAAATSKLLQFIVNKGGEVTTAEAAQAMATSQHVVFNVARELRQLGVLVPKSGSILLSEQFRATPPTENQIRERVARSLQRHTVFAKLQNLIASSPSREVSIDTLALEMPSLFPAVEATPNTWRVYAGSFGSWLDYSGLVQIRGQLLCELKGKQGKVTLLSTDEGLRRNKTFPQSGPETAIAYLRHKTQKTSMAFKDSSKQKAINDLYVLGIVDLEGNLLPSTSDVATKLLSSPPASLDVRELLSRVPGGNEALSLIETQSNASSEKVGEILRDAYGLRWASSTTRMAGTKFRAWARFAGLLPAKSKRKAS